MVMPGGESLGTAPPGRLRRAAERAAASGAVPGPALGEAVGPPDDNATAGDPAQQSGGDGKLLVGGDLVGGYTQITADDFVSINNYLTASPPEPAIRTLPAAEVARQRTVLVEPPGYDRALVMLRTHRLVLLLGQSGTGRETAGLGLFADTAGGADVVVVRDPTRAELDDYEWSDGCRVVVDLRHAEGVAESLADLIGRITEASGYLIVLSEPGLHTLVEETYGRYVCVIDAVSAADVLSVRLRGRREADSFVAAVERSEAVQEFCRGARPGMAVRLATQLLAQPGRPTADAELTSWLARAVKDFARFGNQVTVRFDAADRLLSTTASSRPESRWDNTTGEGESLELERSLLLSAALVENLRLTALQIEDVLLDQLGRPIETHPLGRVGLGVRLSRLDNVIRGDDGLVTFKHESHAIDLLCHVWANYPHLQSALLAWVRSIPDAAALSLERTERFAVAAQFVKLCDRMGAGQEIVGLATEWAEGRRESRVTAILILSKAALSWTIGRHVRRQLYRWAIDEKSSIGIQDVVLRTCSGPFARYYPRFALTRLGHLAERPTWIGPRARTAIVEHARDEAVLPYVVERLAEWCGRNSVRRDIAVEILHELLRSPGDVLATSLGRNRTGVGLVELVRHVLDDRGTDAAKRIIAALLEHALQGDADATVGVVVEAARGSSQRLSKLAWSTAEWLTDNGWHVDGAGTERRQLYERVTASVNGVRSVARRPALLTGGGAVGE